jgi:predicted nucleic acid-binding protein
LARKEIRSYVIDASVVVKWFVDEEDSDIARRIRNHFVDGRLRLIAPDLLKYEVASALRYHPTARIDPPTLITAIDSIENYQLLTTPSAEAWNGAIRLCYECKVSPYDAIYLGLSHTMNYPVLTADIKLLDAVTSETKRMVTLLSKLREPLEDESNN